MSPELAAASAPRSQHASLAHRSSGAAYAAGALAITLFLAINHRFATGALPPEAIAFFAGFTLTCLAYGFSFRRLLARWVSIDFRLPFDVLGGFFLANTLLFVVSLASPWGMQRNALLVALAGIAAAAAAWGMKAAPAVGSRLENRSSDLAGTLGIVISAAAATVWCHQAQTVLNADGLVVYQVWRDTFIHAREISAFAQAGGAATLQDIKLAGGTAQIYHFASYIGPAAAMVFTKASAMHLYTGFQLPVGIFLSGIGAFCLAATFWGSWPAVAATVAIVVLPDAFQQGFANRYLSYHFLSQVNLGMLYGLGCVALSWVFMVLGCRHGKLMLVLLGYVFLLVCGVYKAHIFVASAFLTLMYPVLFFKPVPAAWRAVIGLGFIAVFLGAIMATQSHPRIPVLRLDGSGIHYYTYRLLGDFEAGPVKDFFTPKFYRDGPKPAMAFFAATMILACTFGFWLLLAPLAWWKARKTATWASLAFPLTLGVNYLVMSMGLALDEKRIGTVDELLNRPLVWAYFGIVLWTAGALYHHAFGDRVPQRAWLRAGALAAIVAGLAWLGVFSRDLQTFPTRGHLAFSQDGAPACMAQAADYIKAHSDPHDVVQPSGNDPYFMFTALVERQLYVGEGPFGGGSVEQGPRLVALSAFLQMTDPAQIRAFAAERNIRWYLLQPVTPAAWPASVLASSAFECDGYKVFRF